MDYRYQKVRFRKGVDKVKRLLDHCGIPFDDIWADIGPPRVAKSLDILSGKIGNARVYTLNVRIWGTKERGRLHVHHSYVELEPDLEESVNSYDIYSHQLPSEFAWLNGENLT